ncbi:MULTISPECIES: hypothetical protein [Spirosoma]|uniref:Uncharacterized protein n=1 Tax=Spirosoma liriopis TaxID=2937440 RepID=A0ABT0HV05_9BACT|nr:MULTISPECIES: hypothetical protein [Spirosoma]MCK8496026.1 hypothetical protein [Spirosoma liriopis]UHG94890.1 hypothetical protein LQ777_30145 [Spirosoma oryzicola]
MKKHIDTEFSFDSWINNDVDSTSDDFGQFDDNWLISADDLFSHLEQTLDEPAG